MCLVTQREAQIFQLYEKNHLENSLFPDTFRNQSSDIPLCFNFFSLWLLLPLGSDAFRSWVGQSTSIFLFHFLDLCFPQLRSFHSVFWQNSLHPGTPGRSNFALLFFTSSFSSTSIAPLGTFPPRQRGQWQSHI